MNTAASSSQRSAALHGTTSSSATGGAAPFVGPYQPTVSRAAESKLWSRARRPGPGTYQHSSLVGRVAESTKRSGSNTKFGTEARDPLVLPSARYPGQLYTAYSGLGGQADARKPTSPRAHFGTSSRFGESARYTALADKVT